MDNFFKFLLESSVCLALFYTVYWVFLKNETYFKLNRLYLVSSMFFSFFIPILNFPSPFRVRELIERTDDFTFLAGSQMQSLGVVDVLIGVYIFMTVMLFARYAEQLFQLHKTIKKHSVYKHEGHRFVYMSQETKPFSFFNLIFLNKSNISRQDYERIISHEMIHIRQYHSVDIVIMELTTILLWFNPFVWPYRKSLKQTHEYLADDGVIAQGCNAAKYQLLIVEQQVGGKLFEFANNFHHSQIKRRLTMMTKIKSKGWAKLKLLLVLPAAFLLVLAFAESQPVSSGTLSGDTLEAVRTDITAYSSQPQEQEKTDAEKKKELEEKKKKEMLKKDKLKQEAIYKKMKELEMKYKETEDVEKKKELKMKLVELKKAAEKMEYAKKKDKYADEEKKYEQMKKELTLKMKELKHKLAETEDPEKQEKIKSMMLELEKKYKAMVAKAKTEKEKK